MVYLMAGKIIGISKNKSEIAESELYLFLKSNIMHVEKYSCDE